MILVLLVEDEKQVARVLKEQLEHGLCFVVDVVETLKDAFLALRSKKYDVALLDLNLPDSQGVVTLERFQETYPEVPFIVVTGGPMIKSPIHSGAQDYIMKGGQTYDSMEHMILHSVERHGVRHTFTPLNQAVQEAKQLLQELQELHPK